MYLKTYIISSFCILFLSFSFGQDTSKYLKPIPIFSKSDSVLRISVLTSSVPHFELSLDKMDELGAIDVGDALKYVPGVLLKDYGGIGGIKTISFRSLGAAHTAVQVDGQQIPNTQSGSINLSSFDLFGLEKISFSSGQIMDEKASASAYIQANTIAINSVLSSQPIKYRLGIYSNSTTINAYEKGGYLQFKIAKHFFIGAQAMLKFGNGEYNYTQPDLLGDTIKKRENTALFNYRGRLVAGFVGKKTKITLAVFHSNNRQELPGAAVLYNPSNDQKLWNRDGQYTLNHSYKSKNNKWKILSHANIYENYTHYYDPHFLNLQGYIDAEYYQKNYTSGILISKTFRFPTEKLFFGTDLNYATLKSAEILSDPTRIQSNTVLGGATLLNRFRIDANITTQYIVDTYYADKKNQTKTFFKLSPFIALAYIPFDKKRIRLRSFYKSTYRMPTFNDLYYNFIGNTNLKPEDADLFNIGITYGFKKKKQTIEFTGDIYQNFVNNKIVAIPTKNLFSWSMQNIGKTSIKGMDLGLLYSLKMKKVKINITTNHSFNSSLDITNKANSTYRHQIPYTPYYTSSYGVSVSVRGFVFSSNVLYYSYRFSLNENIYANLLPAYTDINVGLSKKLKWKQADLLIDLKAMNILNKNYQVIRSFPMPGRYYQLRLKYTIDK